MNLPDYLRAVRNVPTTQPPSRARGRLSHVRVRWTEMSPRGRLLAAAGAISVLLLVAVILVLARRDSTTSKSNARAMAGSQSMEGMAGMNVTENGSVKLTADQIRWFGITFGTAEIHQHQHQDRQERQN